MNILKSVSKFNVWDPCPGVPLDEITPLSRRCWSLLVRNKDGPTLQEGYSQIAGAIEMLSGLEYHHDNVVRISGMLAAGEMEDDTGVYHEAVAYVNRLGQIYYFAKSSLASRCVSDLSGAIPTILKYLPFRMKHSAHRSIDYPRGESEDTQLFQTTALTRFFGRIMLRKPGARAATPLVPDIRNRQDLVRFHQTMWRDNYVAFQMYDQDAKSHLNLILEIEHPQISRETYDLLASVITWKPSRLRNTSG